MKLRKINVHISDSHPQEDIIFYVTLEATCRGCNVIFDNRKEVKCRIISISILCFENTICQDIFLVNKLVKVPFMKNFNRVVLPILFKFDIIEELGFVVFQKYSLRKHAYLNKLKILPPKEWKSSDKKFWYFSYFCSKHRLWVLVRTASPRRF